MSPFILFSFSGEVPEALHALRDGVDIVLISRLSDVKADVRPAVLILTAELAEDDGLEQVPTYM